MRHNNGAVTILANDLSCILANINVSRAVYNVTYSVTGFMDARHK